MQTPRDFRIVVLGAAGFIGFHISNSLAKQTNLSLILVDNFVRGERDNQFLKLISNQNVEFKQLDLSIENSYLNLFKEGDIVLNCAALNGTQNFYNAPTQVIRNSAISSILAAEFAAKSNVSKYIYFGSAESYAGGINLGITEIPTNENVPLVIENPINLRWSYAASKSMGEISTIANHFQFGLKAFILRVHNIYGPRMGLNHVIPDLVSKFLAGNFEVYGVNESRAFMYVQDLVSIVEKFVFSEINNNEIIYNVGSVIETNIGKLAQIILKELNIEIEIKQLPSFDGSVSRRVPDITKLKNQFDFLDTDIVVGIRKYINWYKDSLK